MEELDKYKLKVKQELDWLEKDYNGIKPYEMKDTLKRLRLRLDIN